jgi:hypothetical protein
MPREKLPQFPTRLRQIPVLLTNKNTSSYFTVRHKRSGKMLSKQRPFPSMLIRIPAICSRPVNASLVNWHPWSLLNISGRRLVANAPSNATKQKSVSGLADTSHDNTKRLCQSMIAVK